MTAQEIKERREKITKLVASVMAKLDPPAKGQEQGDNEKFWTDLLTGFTDEQFGQFIRMIKNKKASLYITMPNMTKSLKINNLVAAADSLGLPLSHRLWLPDKTRPGKKYLTNEKYLVLELPIRRAQQEWDKKLSVPSRAKKVDALTGQVVGDDRACAISSPEIQALNVRGLPNTMMEIVKVRGGDVHAYSDFNRQLMENGQASLSKLDPRSRARSATIAHVLLESMLIANNL